ncbi:hypothetical protein MTO96_026477 [Rhipicephalus appendiculatus]
MSTAFLNREVSTRARTPHQSGGKHRRTYAHLCTAVYGNPGIATATARGTLETREQDSVAELPKTSLAPRNSLPEGSSHGREQFLHGSSWWSKGAGRKKRSQARPEANDEAQRRRLLAATGFQRRVPTGNAHLGRIQARKA